MFVLQSEFHFNSVPAKTYYRYQTEGCFRLLLVGPDEWIEPYQERFMCSCILHEDRIWTLSLDPATESDQDFMGYLNNEQGKLKNVLENANSIDDVLPAYEKIFYYHSRILTFILGKSLGISMDYSGIKKLFYREAKSRLQHD